MNWNGYSGSPQLKTSFILAALHGLSAGILGSNSSSTIGLRANQIAYDALWEAGYFNQTTPPPNVV